MAIFVHSPINVEVVDNDATEIRVLAQSMCGTYKRYFGPFSTAGEAAEAADAIVRGIKNVGGVMTGSPPLRREPERRKMCSEM